MNISNDFRINKLITFLIDYPTTSGTTSSTSSHPSPPECSTWHKFPNPGDAVLTQKCPISNPEDIILTQSL